MISNHPRLVGFELSLSCFDVSLSSGGSIGPFNLDGDVQTLRLALRKENR
jgi:hypothetical protein